MTAPSQPMVTLGDISLKKMERGFLVGGTGTGKSTCAEYLIKQFGVDYKNSRILVADTKPRFLGEYEMSGLSAKKRYSKWEHGAFLPNSMVLQTGLNPVDQLNNVWRHGRIALVQTASQRDIGWSVACIDAFLKQARKGRPQLIYVDEGLDFFHSNAVARGGEDAILRSARAGRERGVSLLFGSQRPKGIPLQIMTEMTKLYMFLLDYQKDIVQLGDMGYPFKEYPAPATEHIFRFWDKSHRDRPPALMKLKVR